MVIGIVFILFSTSANAQLCLREIFNREGTVHSSGPANMEFKATSKNVTINFEKTGGKANARLIITKKYDNGDGPDIISFDFDEALSTKSVQISNVKGNTLLLKLENNSSLARTINYKIKATGRTKGLLMYDKNQPDPSRHVAVSVGPQKKKTYLTAPSCADFVKVTVNRISSSGDANMLFFVSERIEGPRWRQLETEIIRPRELEPRVYVFETKNPLKIVCENNSVGLRVTYHLSVEAYTPPSKIQPSGTPSKN